ncbi:MAG: corrinoid protein [Acidimicrobiia bacterium]|nr:MAG: corrinoid protein [Acidimicrobiia bacterium]
MGGSNEYENLREAILDGDREAAVAIGHDAIEAAQDLTEPVGVASGVIREVGDKFGTGELFLPEMVLAAEAMQAFMDVVTPHLESEATEGASARHGKVVIGTVQGDIHSIGKNIVATMLSASGYEVVDLGVNVVPMDAIKAAESGGASIIGLSALMTTSMPYQKEVIDLLDAMNQRDDFWVIIGGGPVTMEYADDINANGWAPDAAAAVQVCDHMLSSKTTPASTNLVYRAAG